MWGQCCSWDIQSWLWNIFLLYLFELATKNVAIGWAETLKCNQSWFSKYFKSSTLYITGMLLPHLCWCIAAFIDVLLLCLSIRWQRDTVWRDVYHVILVCVREWYEIKGNQLIKKKILLHWIWGCLHCCLPLSCCSYSWDHVLLGSGSTVCTEGRHTDAIQNSRTGINCSFSKHVMFSFFQECLRKCVDSTLGSFLILWFLFVLFCTI